jgi:hypothetical protein
LQLQRADQQAAARAWQQRLPVATRNTATPGVDLAVDNVYFSIDGLDERFHHILNVEHTVFTVYKSM